MATKRILAQTSVAVDARIADPGRAGTVRIAMLPPQYRKDLDTGQLLGWAVDLAHAFAQHHGASALPIECFGPDEVVARLADGSCDAGFLPNNPAWGEFVEFSTPFLEIEFTFLVPGRSLIGTVADADRPGVRIAVVRGHASTLTLRGRLRDATIVTAETLEDAFELLRRGDADTFASTRPQLIEDCDRLPGSKVLEDSYGTNGMTLAVARGRAERLACANEFVEKAKLSRMVARAVERAGCRGVRIPQDVLLP